MHPAAAMRVARPFTVRLSSGLLFAVAGLALLEATLELVFATTDLSTYRDAYTGTRTSGFASLAGFTLDLFFAAGATVLAILNNHGRNNARVATLVLGGLFLFCGGVGNLSDALHRPSRSAGVLPVAYGITVGILSVLTVLGVLAALVLLALPPSNRFFQVPAHLPPPAAYGPPFPGPFAAPSSAPFPAPSSAPFPAPSSAPFPAPTSSPFPAPSSAPFPAPTSASFPAPEQAPHTGSMPAIDPWAGHDDKP